MKQSCSSERFRRIRVLNSKKNKLASLKVVPELELEKLEC